MKKNYQNDKIHLIFIRNFIYECEEKKKKSVAQAMAEPRWG